MEIKTLHKVSYGMYVIGSKKDGRFNGQIANTVFQITSEPPTIAVSINKQNLTHEFIESCNAFSVSILSVDTPAEFIGLFGFKSGRDVDKFGSIKYKTGRTGVPIAIENAVGYIEAEVINKIDAGTHTVFIGNVVDAEILKDGEPMTYAYYHEIKKGLSPKAAPTYIREELERTGPVKEEEKMDKYKCTVCGYIYDPERGDPDSGIEPGRPFEELPDDWVCPVCGADKSAFEKI